MDFATGAAVVGGGLTSLRGGGVGVAVSKKEGIDIEGAFCWMGWAAGTSSKSLSDSLKKKLDLSIHVH